MLTVALAGEDPQLTVLQAGTYNLGGLAGDDAKVEEVAAGIGAIIKVCREKAPDATVLITGIFPLNDNMAAIPTINRINARLARLADGGRVRSM